MLFIVIFCSGNLSLGSPCLMRPQSFLKQVHQKSVIFATIFYFLDKNVNYESYLCNGCHNLMQKAMNFNDVAIVSIKGNDYIIHFWYMSKNDAIALMTNSNLNYKNRVL